MNPTKVFLDEAEWLEISPTFFTPTTGDERLAAVIGYLTGDGSISSRSGRYTKKSGEVSVYAESRTGAFYSNHKEDLELIRADLISLGLVSEGVNVTLKKNQNHEDGYQLQIGKHSSNMLVASGAPENKKTMEYFEVPDWILSGTKDVKRAYLSALFGAEGNRPSTDESSQSRMPRMPKINMCKIEPVSGKKYFEQLQSIMTELGVSSTVSVTSATKYGKNYSTYWLSVHNTYENLIQFFSEVGYTYCNDKSVEGWKWLQYLKAYRFECNRRKNQVLEGISKSETWKQIGERIGLTPGAAHRIAKSIEEGKETKAGHSFPRFSEWISERWIESLGLLKVKVASKQNLPKQEVWNLLVSSPDHSYLLASGANNFNSFENMSGRVYHQFDRKIHVGDYPFNPKLPIWVGQDFNVDPMSTVILQPQPNGELWAVDEIFFHNSNTQEVCEELERRYWRYTNQVIIYPDPAGGNRSSARGESDLDIFREKGFKKIKYRKKHPPVVDRINAVNRMCKDAAGNIRLRVNKKCYNVITSLEQTIYKEGSPEVNKSMGVEHMADAIGYPIEIEFPTRKIKIAGRNL